MGCDDNLTNTMVVFRTSARRNVGRVFVNERLRSHVLGDAGVGIELPHLVTE